MNRPLRSPPAKKPRSRQNRAGSALPETRKPLVMGHVTILKRGVALKPSSNRDEPSPLCSTKRLGSDPAILLNPDPIFAGPAFDCSPDPRSVPFPLFLKKGGDVAGRGLRCLLRLD